MPGGIQVRDLDGRFWTIRRRWIPHREGIGLEARLLRRRRKKRSGRRSDESARWWDFIDVPDLGDVFDALLVLIAVVLVVLFVVFIGWPLVLLGIDLAWLVLMLIVGTVARALLGRPWRVEATSDDDRRDWYVKGFRAAGAWRDELARQFQHGQNPSPSATP